ncbi:3' exoribonuclease family domain-containing protein [Ceratobasidium sp. AG-Ba]|nr:3' exoribonuclease family domain-containing protein [Ceratobasidium sp. AG-Ba]
MHTVSKAEAAYIRTSLLTSKSVQLRGDGRTALAYRPINVELGVAPTTNGSARARIGQTEVWTGIKLEVEKNATRYSGSDGKDGGRVEVAVTCTPGSHPHLSGQAVEDLSLELSNQCMAVLPPFLIPNSQFTIVPGHRSWFVHIDSLVISDDGNLFDVIWMSIRGALWDLRIPRPVSFRARDSDRVQKGGDVFASAVKTRHQTAGGKTGAGDFEMPDYWDDGEPLLDRESLPVCITYNMLPPIHFLDATISEELSVPSRISLVFSCPHSKNGALQTPLLLGSWMNSPSDSNIVYLASLIKDCEVILAAGLFVSTALAQSPLYGQCGGINWNGATTCVSGSVCTKINDYYYQCIPGTAPPASTTKPPTSTVTATGPIISTTTKPSTTVTGGGTVGPTLLPNYLWIRAVAAPNFHKYLQSYKPGTATDAVLASASTAGQFAITNGKLTQITPSGALLYANVETRADSTVMKLKVSWQTSSTTSGTFVWSGDALTWTVEGITRPNNAAWLACTDATEGQVLYANLGPYAYNTPAGCADQTIHFYNGATADV